MTINTDNPANVPLPAGCVRVYDWDPPEVTGYPTASRYFVGTSRVVEVEQHEEDITVTVDGMQWSDGRVERSILVDQTHPDDPLTPQQARELAAALVGAADEFEQMAGYDRIEVRR